MTPYSLKQVTFQNNIEPVALDFVKAVCRIDGTADDDSIRSWIRSGRELAEKYQRRSYLPQTWEMTFDEFPETPLLLPRSPIVSVLSVTYYDYLNVQSTMSLSDLIIDTDSEPGRIDLAYGKLWPSVTLRPMSAVKIRFTSGYGANDTTALARIPNSVKDAIALYCSFRNENRAAESDAVPETFYSLLRHDRIYLS